MNSQVTYVLLVEDDIDYSALLRRRLMGGLNQNAETAFVVAQTSLLHEAVEYVTNNTVDVVVLDLNLPDALGLETLQQIRRAAPHAATIVLTGREDQAVAETAMQMGAQDYLCKGNFNTELLVRAIRYALDRKQSEEVLSQVEAKLRTMDRLTHHTNSHVTADTYRDQPQSAPQGLQAVLASDSQDIATDFDTLLSNMAVQNSMALSHIGNDNPARVHVEKLHQTINLATALTKRLFQGLRSGD